MSGKIPKQKLIITIVRKEKAKKVIHASKNAGAQGGTTLLGTGIRLNEKNRFLGIPVKRERAVILTLVGEDIFPQVMSTIIDAVHLDQPRQGIGFVIDPKKVTGIYHLSDLENDEEESPGEDVDLEMEEKIMYNLIITIVNKGDAEKVVDASRRAGAEGGTILNGRGTGVHEQAKLFNILIEPEKELVLTLISKDRTSHVLKKIEEDAKLQTAGKGIAFVMNVDQTVGIHHMLNNQLKDGFK